MDDNLKRIEQKLDELLELAPALSALNSLLIEADYVTKAKGLNKNTISQNDGLEKFNGIGSRKVLVKLESVAVLKQRKRTKKPIQS